jgi:GntR family transcriptional regulator
MKLRLDNRPLYVRAEEAMKELLVNYQPGDQLPPEPQLAEQLGISRSTLREALRSFEERGFIDRRQGVGTFVLAHFDNLLIESGLESLESLDSQARRKGLNVSDRNLIIRESTANAQVAEALHIASGDPVVEVVRTKVTKNRPVAHIIDIIPTTVAQLEQLQEGFKGSVLDFLLDRGSPPLAYARARIIPTSAGHDLGKKLDVSSKTNLLLIEETLYSVDNEPVGFAENYFIPGFFGFEVIRRINE